jgi:hypothetical protein
MLNISQDQVVTNPYPHIIKDRILPQDLYEALKRDFPSQEIFDSQKDNYGLRGSRTGSGTDIYRGDPAFDVLTGRSEAWREFTNYINSKDFMQDTLSVFGDNWALTGCRIDPTLAVFNDYVEPRETMTNDETITDKLSKLGKGVFGKSIGEKNVNELFTRFDIHMGKEAYAKAVHCDRPNRLISLIIYFCDADEIGLVGGDLGIHKHRKDKKFSQYERHPKLEDTEQVAKLRPKDNLGVFFMCTNNSYHSVTEITSASKPRNFLYLNISSMAHDIW